MPTGIECPSCKQTNRTNQGPTTESQEHIENKCEAFKEIRSQYDLSDDHQLVLFFQEALAKRDRLGDEEDDDDNDK